MGRRMGRWMGRWLRNVLVWLDQGLNVVFLGGDPDETISSVLGKRRHRCRICDWICRALDRLDPRHCEKSVERDEGADAIWRER